MKKILVIVSSVLVALVIFGAGFVFAQSNAVSAAGMPVGFGPGHMGGGRGGMMGMRPGVFGTVSAVNGTTITVSGRTGFGSTTPAVTYTVNASNATLKKNNATSTVSSIAVGDTVMVKKNKQKKAYMEKIKDKLKNFQTLDWLSLNPAEFSGKVLSNPVIDSLGAEINTQLIVEHYSRT